MTFGPPPVHGPGWAYLYFASELRLGIATRDIEYLREVQRLVAPGGEAVVNHPEDLKRRMELLWAIVKQTTTLLTGDNSTKAFGSVDTDGDEGAVRVVTSGLVAGYSELLAWSSSARSAKVTAEWAPVYAALSQLAEGPIEAIRQYSVDWDRHSEDQAQALAAGRGDLKGTMILKISISDEAVGRFDTALDALKVKLAAQPA